MQNKLKIFALSALLAAFGLAACDTVEAKLPESIQSEPILNISETLPHNKIEALFSDDHRCITMPGAVMQELGITDLRIIVRTSYNDVMLREADCWFHLRADSCTARGEEHL